jgi:hypothetical protein
LAVCAPFASIKGDYSESEQRRLLSALNLRADKTGVVSCMSKPWVSRI